MSKAKKTTAKKKATKAPSKSSSQVDKLKFALCQEFMNILTKKKINQAELATALEIDPARVSEIFKNKIALFTVDRLLALLEKVNPSVKINIA